MPITRRLGKVIIKIGGQRVESMPDASLDIGGDATSTVIGSNEVLGPSYTPKPSKLECTVSQGTATSASAFPVADVSFSFECDTGQVYACSNAWRIETPHLGKDGWKLVYEGAPCEEVG